MASSRNLVSTISISNFQQCYKHQVFRFFHALYNNTSPEIKEQNQTLSLKKNGKRRFKYLVLGYEETYFVKDHSDSKSIYSVNDIINMFEFLVDTIFVVFQHSNGHKLSPSSRWHHSVFIPSEIHSDFVLNEKETATISVQFHLMMYCP